MGGGTVEHSFPQYYVVGSVETRDPTKLKALVNSAVGLDADRYDTFESPQGTDYVVPTGKTLYICKVQGNGNIPAANIFRAEVGYGSSAVNNSAAAPTGATSVWVVEIMQGNGYLMDLAVWIPIPAGKYPYAKFNQTLWNFVAYGIEV